MDDDDIVGVAERLCEEFSGLLPIRVLEAVSAVADEYARHSSMFLEQAARARLLAQTHARAPAPTPASGPAQHGLSVAS
jgi:hypothetical protein